MGKRLISMLLSIALVLSAITVGYASALQMSYEYDEASHLLSVTVSVGEPDVCISYKTVHENGTIAYLGEKISGKDGTVTFTFVVAVEGMYTCYANRTDTGESASKTMSTSSGEVDDIISDIKAALQEQNEEVLAGLLEKNAEILGLKLTLYDGDAAGFVKKVAERAIKLNSSVRTKASVAQMYYSCAAVEFLNGSTDIDSFTTLMAAGEYRAAFELDKNLPKDDAGNVYTIMAADVRAYVDEAVSARHNYENIEQIITELTQNIIFKNIKHGTTIAKNVILKAYNDKGLLQLSWSKFSALSETKQRLVIEAMSGDYTTYVKVTSDFNSAVDAQSASGDKAGTSSGKTSSGGSGYNITAPVDSDINSSTTQMTETQAPAAQYIFKDMENYKWAIEAVEYLYKKGIVSGVTEDTYEPSRSITRAEFSKLLMTIVDAKSSDGVTPFADVSAEDWSYSYILKAYQNGIVFGMEADKFGKNEYVTREQAAVFIERLISRFEIKKPDPGLNIFIEFDDMEDVADWSKEAVLYLLRITMIKGKENKKFMPKDEMTRAEAAVLLYSYLNVLGKLDK